VTRGVVSHESEMETAGSGGMLPHCARKLTGPDKLSLGGVVSCGQVSGKFSGESGES
jgi:hypothetical protein